MAKFIAVVNLSPGLSPGPEFVLRRDIACRIMARNRIAAPVRHARVLIRFESTAASSRASEKSRVA